MGRAEQFQAHDGAGERRVGRAGKDRDEAERGEQIDGGAEEKGERVAEGGADEEERRDFAAFESAAERDGGEEQFPPPAPRRGAAGGERGKNGDGVRVGRGDPEAEVIARAYEPDQPDDQYAADGGPQGGVGQQAGEGFFDQVGELGEALAHEPEEDRGEDNLAEEGAVEEGVARVTRDEGDVVGCVVDAPERAREIADEAGDEHGDQGVVADVTDDEHLQGEDGSGERGAEDRTETGGDAGQQEDAAVFGGDFGEPAKQTREASAHLDGRALAAGGAAAEVGKEGAGEDEGSHAPRHAAAGRVDFLHNEVGAGVRFFSEVMIDPADRQAADGQEEQQPRVFPAQAGHVIERPQKERAGRAGQDRHREDEQRPLQEVTQVFEMLADVAELLHRRERGLSGIGGVEEEGMKARSEAAPTTRRPRAFGKAQECALEKGRQVHTVAHR